MGIERLDEADAPVAGSGQASERSRDTAGDYPETAETQDRATYRAEYRATVDATYGATPDSWNADVRSGGALLAGPDCGPSHMWCTICLMRYTRAVEKLRLLAEGCERIAALWAVEDEEPFLVAMYAFGDVLQGIEPIEVVQVAGVLRLPPEEVTWGSSPPGTEWLADQLRLSKGGFEYFWRSYLDPVWNHYIRSPARIWSQDGVDDDALAALAARRFTELRHLTPDPVEERLQVRDDLDTVLRHLRDVHGSYWDQKWRREHRGFGRYPEHELWEAVDGYLDLLKASRPAPRPDDGASPTES